LTHQTKQDHQKANLISVNQASEHESSGGISMAPPVLKIYANHINVPNPRDNLSRMSDNPAASGKSGNGILQLQRGRSHTGNADWIDFAAQLQNYIEGVLERHPDRYSPIRMRIEAQGLPAMFNELTELISQMTQVEGEVPQRIIERLNQIFVITHNAETPERSNSRERQHTESTENVEAGVGSYPDYFGPISTDAMQRIETQAQNWRWVGRLTVVATVVSLGSSQSGRSGREAVGNAIGTLTQGSHDVENQANALRGMPDIARRYIIDIATLTYVEQGISPIERLFWEQLIINLGGTV